VVSRARLEPAQDRRCLGLHAVPYLARHVVVLEKEVGGEVDRYASGEGTLEGRLFRLVPVMRASGPELSVGEAMRYLAELPWVPYGMLANLWVPKIRFRLQTKAFEDDGQSFGSPHGEARSILGSVVAAGRTLLAEP
jgi:hypothetical protein